MYTEVSVTMMKRCILVVAMVIAVVAAGQVIANTPISHGIFDLRQAYPASQCPAVRFSGFGGAVPVDHCAIPGFFEIDPGSAEWSNFVTAAGENIPYVIKTISLEKKTPEVVQCSSMFPGHKVVQAGTPNIRLRWPLMYEVPGTVWTLSITYGTTSAVQLPGELPGTQSYVHQDVWRWVLNVDLDDIKTLLVLFRQLPFGKDEVPLISDEALYFDLQRKLDEVEAALAEGDTATAAAILTDFELEVMDACITVSPTNPAPGGPGTGIANTEENPACCKLLADVESILFRELPPPPPQVMTISLSANPPVLWPSDGRLVPVWIDCQVVGGGSYTYKVVSVKANEPIKEPDYRGSGGDYRIAAPNKVYLKATRLDKWKDRVYTVTVAITDSNGKSVSQDVKITVPRLFTGY